MNKKPELQEYIPEVVNIYKDYLYLAKSALIYGLENTQELLLQEEKCNEISKRNKIYIEKLKNEIDEIKDAIKKVSTFTRDIPVKKSCRTCEYHGESTISGDNCEGCIALSNWKNNNSV